MNGSTTEKTKTKKKENLIVFSERPGTLRAWRNEGTTEPSNPAAGSGGSKCDRERQITMEIAGRIYITSA